MAAPVKARLGTPDMKPIVIGGPSAAASAKFGFAELLLGLLRQIINYVGNTAELAKAQAELRTLETRITRDRKANPTRGVLVSLRFVIRQASPEAAGSGDPHRYVGYDYGLGATPTEARRDQFRHATLGTGTRNTEKLGYLPVWFPPISPLGTYQRPFPVIGHGCFVDGRAMLQDVRYSTLQGFDNERAGVFRGQRDMKGPGNVYRFDILKPPARLVTNHKGVIAPAAIPVVRRLAGAGGKMLEVVNLNTTMPGDVTAAMIFPADIATEIAFTRTPQTVQDPLGALVGLVNFDKLRWARPENIHVLSP